MSASVLQEIAARRIRNPEPWISCQLSMLSALKRHFSIFIQKKQSAQPEKKIQHMCTHRETLSANSVFNCDWWFLPPNSCNTWTFQVSVGQTFEFEKEREREKESSLRFFSFWEFRRGRLFADEWFWQRRTHARLFSGCAPCQDGSVRLCQLGRQDLPGRDTGLSCSPGMLLPLWAWNAPSGAAVRSSSQVDK